MRPQEKKNTGNWPKIGDCLLQRITHTLVQANKHLKATDTSPNTMKCENSKRSQVEERYPQKSSAYVIYIIVTETTFIQCYNFM